MDLEIFNAFSPTGSKIRIAFWTINYLLDSVQISYKIEFDPTTRMKALVIQPEGIDIPYHKPTRQALTTNKKGGFTRPQLRLPMIYSAVLKPKSALAAQP